MKFCKCCAPKKGCKTLRVVLATVAILAIAVVAAMKAAWIVEMLSGEDDEDEYGWE